MSKKNNLPTPSPVAASVDNTGHATGPEKIVTPSNEVKSEFPEGEIEVTANQEGFYNQRRIAKGEFFSVKSFKDLGSWMICEDKAQDKLRLKMIEDRKIERKKAAIIARKEKLLLE